MKMRDVSGSGMFQRGCCQRERTEKDRPRVEDTWGKVVLMPEDREKHFRRSLGYGAWPGGLRTLISSDLR